MWVGFRWRRPSDTRSRLIPALRYRDAKAAIAFLCDAFGFTEHLVEYALGRPFGFTDEDLAMEITTAAQAKDYAVSEFIHALVRSEAFHQK